MKVAILSPWTVSKTAVGGTERFVLDLARSLKELGNDVDVYMLSGENHEINGIKFINVQISNDEYMDELALQRLFGDFSDYKTYDRVARILEEAINLREYDLVQLNSQLFLRAWKDKKRIFTIHTNPFEYELSFGKDSFQVMLDIMREESQIASTVFVTPSYYYATVYNKLTGVNIETIPHAIDINRISCETTKGEICSQFGLDNNLINILLPSRLEPIQKQPMLFMKAFADMDLELKNKCQVICTGLDKQYIQYAADIEEFCKDNNIRLRIIRFDSMADAYKIANVVVLPSQSESFGYSALEALSLGIPTILNSIPTYLEIATGSKNVYLFKNDVETLKTSIKNIFSSDLAREVQTADWQSKYNLNVFGERYINLFK